MAIRVVCGCGKAFDVPDAYAGKSGKCKACGAKFTVPFQPSPDSIEDPFAFTDKDEVHSKARNAPIPPSPQEPPPPSPPAPVQPIIAMTGQESEASCATTVFNPKKPERRSVMTKAILGASILGIGVALVPRPR